MQAKPRRRFSKRITSASMAWGMVMPALAMFFQPDLFAAAMTGGVATIGGALGGYMGTGHADYRATMSQQNHAADEVWAPPAPDVPEQHGMVG